MSQRPDVLFIILDTLRYDRLSLSGYPKATSPHLDAFAQHSTTFRHAISPAQWTIPAHASLFTGLYPKQHGLTQAHQVLSGQFPTLAEILSVADYHTVAFSNNPLVGIINNGLTRGFSAVYNYSGLHPNRPHSASTARLSRQFRRLAHRLSNQFAQHDPLFRLSLSSLWFPLLTRLVNYKGNTQHTVDDVLAYWSNRPTDQPTFAFINLMGSHLPYHPPKSVLKQLAPELADNKPVADFIRRFNADPKRWASPVDEPLPDWQTEALDAYYTAEIAHQDAHLGRLLRTLKQSDALDNTLVIITADHGEAHGDHSFFGHGFVVNQELVHVPLVIHYPAVFPADAVVDDTISTRRLFHTILELTGVAPPLADDDPNADVAGLSLVNLVDAPVFAEAVPPQTFLHVLEYTNPKLIDAFQLTQTRRAVYQNQHKLTTIGNAIDSLYQVMDDSTELTNLVAQYPNEAEVLYGHLRAFMSLDAVNQSAPGKVVSSDVADNLRALGYFD